MNYLFSFAICVSLTVLSALSKDANLYWLIASDANVAVFLFLAYVMKGKV